MFQITYNFNGPRNISCRTYGVYFEVSLFGVGDSFWCFFFICVCVWGGWVGGGVCGVCVCVCVCKLLLLLLLLLLWSYISLFLTIINPKGHLSERPLLWYALYRMGCYTEQILIKGHNSERYLLRHFFVQNVVSQNKKKRKKVCILNGHFSKGMYM